MSWPVHIVAAAGYVEDANGNILIVKTHNRGWDAPGGQIEIGEGVEEGVLRDIMEESGIKASVRRLVGIYSNVGQHLYYDGVTHVPTKVMMDFICDYVEGEPTTSDETSAVKWVPRDRVMDYITSPAQRFRFQRALAFNGQACYCSYVSKPAFEVLSDRFV